MKPSFSPSEKFLLAILACIQFSHIVDFMIMMPLGPQLMRIFEITPSQFGLLVSAYTFSAGISGLVAALYIDKFDRKSCLLFFYIGFSLGTLACGLAKDYSWLLVARSTTGIFGGVLGSLVFSIVSDTIELARRGTAIGVVSAAFSLASVMGVPFSLFLANQFNWHAPFIFLAALSLLMCLASSFLIPSMKNHLKGPHQESNPFHALIHIAQTPNLIYALIFMACLMLGQFTIIPFISPSLVANGGLTEAQLPLIYLVGGTVSIFASPLMGRLSDRHGRKKVFLISAMISIIPIVIITNLGAHPAPLLLSVIAFFFLCMSGRMVPAMATMSAAPTPKYRGSFMSVSSSVQQLSAAAAAYIAGQIVVRDAEGHLLNYAHAGYVAVIFSLMAIFYSQKIKENS